MQNKQPYTPHVVSFLLKARSAWVCVAFPIIDPSIAKCLDRCGRNRIQHKMHRIDTVSSFRFHTNIFSDSPVPRFVEILFQPQQ